MQTHHEEEFTAFATTRHERLRRTARFLTLDQAQADDLERERSSLPQREKAEQAHRLVARFDSFSERRRR